MGRGFLEEDDRTNVWSRLDCLSVCFFRAAAHLGPSGGGQRWCLCPALTDQVKRGDTGSIQASLSPPAGVDEGFAVDLTGN